MSKFDALLQGYVTAQDRLQNHIGQLVAWGTLSLVLITALVVILRYGFDTGSIALQESIMYNHAIVFMLGITYTYLKDEHVRVDVFYAEYSPRKQQWVNLLGSLLLTLPVTLYIIWASSDYIAASWAISERSGEAGGLGYLYLLKTLIVMMAGLLLLQALAIMAQATLTLKGVQSLANGAHEQGGKL